MADVVLGLFRTLLSSCDVLLAVKYNHKEAQANLKTFIHTVKMLRNKHEEWVLLFQKLNLPVDHPAVRTLKDAVDMLQKEEEDSKKYQTKEGNEAKISRTLMSPAKLIGNLDAVITAFDGILVYTREREEVNKLLKDEKNRTFAPFSFPVDDKFVPLEDTVNAVQAHLASETPGGTMVLLHGESGRGKSAIVQYLANKFLEEPESLKFPGGVYFLACEKSSNDLLQLEKFWVDLGFDSQNSYPVHLMSSDRYMTELEHKQIQTQKVEYVRRKIMKELKIRAPRNILIIIDNVWEKEVLDNLWFGPDKHVKYLVTSVKTALSKHVTSSVRLAKPNIEEARQILQTHSGTGTWSNDKPLAKRMNKGIQEFVIEQADYHPWVLASLGAMISDKTLEVEGSKLREYTKGQGMYSLVKHMDERMDQSTSTATADSKNHHPLRIVDSMILAMDFLCEGAKAIVDLVAMCKNLDDTRSSIMLLDERVIKVWFYKTYGKSTNSDNMYTIALAELKAQSIVMFESEDVVLKDGVKERRTRLSMHELRRQCVRDKRKTDLEKRMELMSWRPSGKEYDVFVAVLCCVYFDESWRRRILSSLEIHGEASATTLEAFKEVSKVFQSTLDGEYCEVGEPVLQRELKSQVEKLLPVDVATCYTRICKSSQKAGNDLARKLLRRSIVQELSPILNSTEKRQERRAEKLAIRLATLIDANTLLDRY